MAEVYLAVAKGSGGFNKLQVLKVLRCDQQELDRAELVRMFQDEARLAARLNHPNIVQSYEVGSENGHDFIAMEYLDGQPLNQVRQRDFAKSGDFPLEMQLFVLCQVLEALEYAHTLADYDGRPLNIVHRDVSPQNVFVTFAGQTKLVDFGIAKTLDSCQTRVGVVKGKVHYMAPEQIAGQKVDHRADLFSVGVMLWEAIARRRMHDKDSVYEIMRKVATAELPRIRDVASDVPEELERILNRALAKNPEDRHPNAGALHQELTAYLDRCRRVTPKMVGERVTELFAEERRAITQVIRRAMTDAAQAEITGNVSVPLIPDLNQLSGSADSKSQRFVEAKGEGTAAPTTAPIPYSHRSSAPPLEALPMKTLLSKRSRWLIAGLFVLGISALTAGLAIWVQKPPADAEVEVLAASSDPPAPAPSVRVSIRVSPSTARLVLDGHVLGNGSYEGEHSRDNADHTLDVDSPGHTSRTLKLRFDRDLNLDVRLSEDSAGAEAPVVKAAKPAAPPRGAAARDRNPNRSPRAGEQGDPYGDFPPPKRPAPQGQNFDTSNPWE
jgi:eukaryotic-like serine/threonine-protein kinase